MTRAAIYARFSSDLQNDRSVEDQIAFCREACARDGLDVIMTFEDRAVSGSSTANRPGFQAMMRAAEGRAFDVLFAEDIDRISRDQADYHAARKRLDYLGIAIHTAGSGKVSRIDGALRALMSEIFIENLSLHVRRGLEAVVRDGRLAGGRAYGYRNVPGQPGVLSIDEHESAVVREIFTRFADGESPRTIVGALNRRGIVSPRGKAWNASTLYGNPARGHGILLNRLYIGQLIWNRQRFIKDPATGRKVMRPNPESEHRKTDVPHLRIIDQDLWERVQAVRGPYVAQRPRLRLPPRLLSGLVRCGVCGGPMISIGARQGNSARMQCSAARERETCASRRTFNRPAIEQAALAAVRDELRAPDVIAEYVRTYNAERSRLAREAGKDTAILERRAGELRRGIERLVDALADGTMPKDVAGPKATAMHGELQQVEARLASATQPFNVIALHPGLIARYRQDVEQLECAIERGGDLADNSEVVATFRRLVGHVTIHSHGAYQGFSVEVTGILEALTGSEASLRVRGEAGSERGILSSPLTFTLRRAANF